MKIAEFIYSINKFSEKNKDEIENLSKGQHPNITLVTCSDSRLNAIDNISGLGKVFTIREMGSIINDSSIASIEYSVIIDVKKIIFLSHTNCGAIKGAFSLLDKKNNNDKSEISKSKELKEFLVTNIINPLNLHYNDNLDNAIIKNEEIQVLKLLNKSQLIKDKLKNNEIEIIAMQYSTENGKIQHQQNCIYNKNNNKFDFISRMEYESMVAAKRMFEKKQGLEKLKG